MTNIGFTKQRLAAGNILVWVKILIEVPMRLYVCEKPSQDKNIAAVLGLKPAKMAA